MPIERREAEGESLVEWPAEDHLVWTILGAVDELDLSAIIALIALMVTTSQRMTLPIMPDSSRM